MFNYFANKTCDYCGRAATTFRLIKHRHEYLCDRRECGIRSRVKAGYFGIEYKPTLAEVGI